MDGERWTDDAPRDRRNEYWRRMRDWLRELLGGVCERCEADRQLEFAHLVADGLRGPGRGGNHRVRAVLENPSGYALLCSRCHRQFDRGEFQLRGRWSPSVRDGR